MGTTLYRENKECGEHNARITLEFSEDLFGDFTVQGHPERLGDGVGWRIRWIDLVPLVEWVGSSPNGYGR